MASRDRSYHATISSSAADSEREFCERPMHAKVAVIDRLWATVGSSNLDPLSLALNASVQPADLAAVAGPAAFYKSTLPAAGEA